MDIEELGRVERGNFLAQPRSSFLEYAVHGKWRRAENDTNGDFGCWFIDVEELVQTFGAAAVNEKLEEYEAAQAAARKQAVADAAARFAALLAEDDVCDRAT